MQRLLLLIALFLPALATAQSPAGGVTVRLLAERVPNDFGQVVLSAGEKTGDPFDLPVNNLTEPMAPPARSFGIRLVTGSAPLATVNLPETGKSFIVILIPSATGGYKPVTIPGGDPSFKAGDVYFYNHADKTVIGYVGTATFTLAPGRGQTLRPTGAKEETYYDVGFGVREKEGDRALSTTRWPVEANLRSYVFFFTNPSTNRLDFRAVDEFVTPPAP
jgi:hypothetical protein